MVEKYRAITKLNKPGSPKMRFMTDVSAEQSWTIVTEMEVPSLEAFMSLGENSEVLKEVEAIMMGCNECVDYGRREVYNIEE
jgi:hypothetical protein